MIPQLQEKGNRGMLEKTAQKGPHTMNLPKDPAILLSYVNTQLRDFYPSLEELCKSLDLDQCQLEQTLRAIGYEYCPARNQFV